MAAATKSKRLKLPWWHLLVVGIPVAVTGMLSDRTADAQAVIVGPGDVDDEEDVVLPLRRLENSVRVLRELTRTINGLVDGLDWNSDLDLNSNDGPACTRLRLLLEQKLFVIDSVCGLSGPQKRKLSLAGERDIYRVFDRLETLLNEVRHSGPNMPRAAAIAGWKARAAELRCTMSMGAFDDDSMFMKVLKNVLARDQLASYNALKAIQRLGGEVSIRPGASDGPGIVAEIDLTGTEFGDADAGCLASFPHLESVDLRRTGITDGALNQLMILKNLKRLVLNHTRITDAGAASLAKLPGLQEISLVGTRVSATAVTQLQRALPGLRIEK